MLCDRAQYPKPGRSRWQIALDTLKARTISLSLWRLARPTSLLLKSQVVSPWFAGLLFYSPLSLAWTWQSSRLNSSRNKRQEWTTPDQAPLTLVLCGTCSCLWKIEMPVWAALYSTRDACSAHNNLLQRVRNSSTVCRPTSFRTHTQLNSNMHTLLCYEITEDKE